MTQDDDLGGRFGSNEYGTVRYGAHAFGAHITPPTATAIASAPTPDARGRALANHTTFRVGVPITTDHAGMTMARSTLSDN